MGAGQSLTALLVGLLLALTGVALLTPALVRPVVAVLGAAFAWWTPGRLGGRNSARQPQRTAITAAALMVGISLVVGIGVVLTSVTKTVDQALDDQIKVDLLIAGEQTGALRPTFAGSVLDQTRQQPGVDTVLGVYTDIALLDANQTVIGAVTDSATMRTMFGMRAASGPLGGLGASRPARWTRCAPWCRS